MGVSTIGTIHQKLCPIFSFDQNSPVHFNVNDFPSVTFVEEGVIITTPSALDKTTAFAVEKEGFLLDTLQVITSFDIMLSILSTVMFRLWMYSAVTEFISIVEFPSVTVVRFLVQVTVVAGPPVEMQDSVNW